MPGAYVSFSNDFSHAAAKRAGRGVGARAEHTRRAINRTVRVSVVYDLRAQRRVDPYRGNFTWTFTL